MNQFRFSETRHWPAQPLQEVTSVQFETQKQSTKVIRSARRQSTPTEPPPDELQELVEEAGQEVSPGVKDVFTALVHDL